MGTRVDRIVLIGLRRSGKSTVGRLVSDAIGWTLIDTDELVHRITGTSPADWIRERGLAAFRAAERGAVATLGGARDAVIATGGGVPLSEENRQILRPGALIAYLRVDPWILVGRTLSDPAAALRPPLAAGSPSEENYVLYRGARRALPELLRPHRRWRARARRGRRACPRRVRDREKKSPELIRPIDRCKWSVVRCRSFQWGLRWGHKPPGSSVRSSCGDEC